MSSNGNGLASGKIGKKRRRRVFWAALVVLLLGGRAYGVKAALSPNRTIDPSKLASVERGDLARVVVATGKIEPLSKVEVKSKASGIVKKLFVDYGDRVKQGQILADLDKVQLEAAVRAATANLQAAEAALQSAKATLERNKVDAEGPDVPFLKLSMERAEQMYKDGVMSKSLVEDAEKNYQLALNKQVSAQRNLLVSQAEIAKCDAQVDRKSTRLNSSHGYISYAVFCLKKKNNTQPITETNIAIARFGRARFNIKRHEITVLVQVIHNSQRMIKRFNIGTYRVCVE